jgi:hypothetical protein
MIAPDEVADPVLDDSKRIFFIGLPWKVGYVDVTDWAGVLLDHCSNLGRSIPHDLTFERFDPRSERRSLRVAKTDCRTGMTDLLLELVYDPGESLVLVLREIKATPKLLN